MSFVDSKNRKLDKRVKITNANGRHSHGYRPSTKHLVHHNKKAGTLSIYIPHEAGHATKSKAINTLLEMMRYEYHVNSRTIYRLLNGVVTPGVPIKSALISNLRARTKVIISSIEKDNFGVERLVGITTEAEATLLEKSTSDSLNGKMCGVDLNYPDLVGFHTKQLRTMPVGAPEKGKEVDQIISFLARAKYADKFFDYRVSYHTDKNISGVFWQTGTTRQHCKDGLLDIIMLDIMELQINSANWPYCGPTTITGENIVVCACEAIVI